MKSSSTTLLAETSFQACFRQIGLRWLHLAAAWGHLPQNTYFPQECLGCIGCESSPRVNGSILRVLPACPSLPFHFKQARGSSLPMQQVQLTAGTCAGFEGMEFAHCFMECLDWAEEALFGSSEKWRDHAAKLAIAIHRNKEKKGRKGKGQDKGWHLLVRSCWSLYSCIQPLLSVLAWQVRDACSIYCATAPLAMLLLWTVMLSPTLFLKEPQKKEWEAEQQWSKEVSRNSRSRLAPCTPLIHSLRQIFPLASWAVLVHAQPCINLAADAISTQNASNDMWKGLLTQRITAPAVFTVLPSMAMLLPTRIWGFLSWHS